MTDDECRELKELAEKATLKLPLTVEFDEYGGYDCMSAAFYIGPATIDVAKYTTQRTWEEKHADHPEARADATYLAAAANAVPRLMADRERLIAMLARSSIAMQDAAERLLADMRGGGK